jgi:hypothetical protein
MAQAVTMFDGWFAGQRLSTTQRYLQVTLVTANAIVKLNFQLSVSRPHFFLFVLFLLFNSSSFFLQCAASPLHNTYAKKEKTNKWMRNALGSPFNNCLKETKKRHWIKCEGGLCEGKISDQLTHQLAVAVIGERANGGLLFFLKTEYTM